MKKLVLLAITVMMTLQSISQAKQTASAEKVCLNPEDLKLIIKSNEVGKIAISKLFLLNEKVEILERNISLYEGRINLKDTIINAQANKEAAYLQIISNHQQIEKNINSNYDFLKSEYKNYRNKQTAIKIIGTTVITFLSYLLLK